MKKNKKNAGHTRNVMDAMALFRKAMAQAQEMDQTQGIRLLLTERLHVTF